MIKPDMTDEQLLAAFVRGRRDALGELARRYERLLLGLALGMLGGRRDLAADAIQETWVRVIRFASGFKGGSSVKTWLYRIAVNQCRTFRVRLEKGKPPTVQTPEIAAVETESEYGEHERRQTIRSAVNRLAASKRDIVLLCYHAGITHEQAAEILEIPLGTLKSRLHGTLEELRAMLAPEALA